MTAHASWAIWAIVSTSTALVLIRPYDWPEAIWAVAGAAALVVLRLLPADVAWHAVGQGSDVYLFLTGMMLLSEIGREAGLFDWAAALAVGHARGSGWRLFALVYGVGVVVTTFMSNDAAAVVLTPAVVAAARKARIDPLPNLFACAMVANAASFVLPMSNPANIVLYGNHTPALGAWLRSFLLPSLASIVVTYLALGWTQRRALAARCRKEVRAPALDGRGRLALAGIVATAIVLLVVSSRDIPLGPPTAVMGGLTAAAVWLKGRSSPVATIRSVNWAVLPLVAGLFVLVAALDATGIVDTLAAALGALARGGVREAAAIAGTLLAVGSNATNNLPAGLVASAVIGRLQPDRLIVDALLIGVDLGPNLSVTGSLATILWLVNVRRAGLDVSFWQFLKVGLVAMPAALAAALAARLWM
ncbi:SLC13 family permease [Massilia sp. TN1-12]|uniref:SLC13 family permease n=1 Tax=Massilia paldalensis TaxID=3377675 RepID=UPI00384FDF2C